MLVAESPQSHGTPLATSPDGSQLPTLSQAEPENGEKQIQRDRFQPFRIQWMSHFTSAERQKESIMRKQMLKGFTMLMLVVALAFVTAVASANGQSRAAKADVP